MTLPYNLSESWAPRRPDRRDLITNNFSCTGRLVTLRMMGFVLLGCVAQAT